MVKGWKLYSKVCVPELFQYVMSPSIFLVRAYWCMNPFLLRQIHDITIFRSHMHYRLSFWVSNIPISAVVKEFASFWFVPWIKKKWKNKKNKNVQNGLMRVIDIPFRTASKSSRFLSLLNLQNKKLVLRTIQTFYSIKWILLLTCSIVSDHLKM